MTDRTPLPKDALRGLRHPLFWTRAGLVAERGSRAFWPAWTIALIVLAALAFRLADHVAPELFWAVMALAGLGFAWTMLRGLRQFRWPSQDEAAARLDATLPGRPIAALADTPAIGRGDAQSEAVWRAHLRRMADRVADARAPVPDLALARRDPFALRLMAATAFAAALLFGAIWQVGEVPNVVAGPSEASSAGPSWEGWVEPPLYTGSPTLYLGDITQEAFDAPIGSRISIRFYGSETELTFRQTVSATPRPEGSAETDAAQNVTLDRDGTLTIGGPGGRSWTVSATPDQPPAVVVDGALEGVPPGQFQLPFAATDDHAVLSGRAIIRLNPAGADRRYGLAVEPEPRDAVVLDLPMPFSGGRAEFSEVLIDDLSEHPFANLPVTISLEVSDHAGQIGTSTESFDRLPGRRFFDPLANALVEMRRDLLWSRENAARTTQILRAVTWQPEDSFRSDDAFRMVRRAIRILESGVDGISEESRDEVAGILWEAALMIEEGDLADALENLRRAQDRLQEAMRQGASDEEIAELMDELRQAMDDYMQELAENAEREGTDEPDQSGERTEMSMADIEEMLRQIEELMQQGRMAEAMEMMEALRQMMENMEITEGGEGGDGPRTPGQEAMEGLQESLRDQQDLSDDSFQELQEQFNPGRPNGQQPQGQQNQQGQNQQSGQQGEPGEGNPNGQTGQGQGGENDGRSLAERQQDLLRQLQQQSQNLPGGATESGEEAERLLEEAGRAMDEAADALERGDLPGALDNQSDAMEAMRQGMAELGRALAEEQGLDEPGQGQAQTDPNSESPMQDPLGRQAGNSGAFGTEEGFEQREEAFRRSRELLDELRRRSAEQSRPDVELDYLGRLLERF